MVLPEDAGVPRAGEPGQSLYVEWEFLRAMKTRRVHAVTDSLYWTFSNCCDVSRVKRGLSWPETSCGEQAYQCPVLSQMSLGMAGKSQVHRNKDAFWTRLLGVAVTLLSFLPTHPRGSLWEKGVLGL